MLFSGIVALKRVPGSSKRVVHSCIGVRSAYQNLLLVGTITSFVDNGDKCSNSSSIGSCERSDALIVTGNAGMIGSTPIRKELPFRRTGSDAFAIGRRLDSGCRQLESSRRQLVYHHLLNFGNQLFSVKKRRCSDRQQVCTAGHRGDDMHCR